ncbi:MAG: hypothetical protein CMO55_16670 [Verrucomicrobiales bacterium]|nr:hypothetical protein [Verrucomicrobiales bacterium]
MGRLFVQLLVVSSLLSNLVSAQVGGLDSASPIGPFLDGALPSETPKSASGSWEAVTAFPLLDLEDPLQMLPVPGTNQILIAQKDGQIVVFENTPTTSSDTELLNIFPQVEATTDSGLLGLALHPEFGQVDSPNRDYIYAYYRYTPDKSETEYAYCRLSRFSWRVGTNSIDPNSELVLIQQFDVTNIHNGGGLFFGSEGFLYLCIGEDGVPGKNDIAAQRTDLGLLAGVLRIDVDQDSSRSHPIRRQPQNPETPPPGWPDSFSQGYYIPNDNPWQSPSGSTLEEFWAIGLRSPHRMTHDPVTNNIWVGDVGGGQREEVSLITKGSNLQWPYREGDTTGLLPKPENLIGTDQPPVYAYPRSVGGCIIGGYVYRGLEHPDLVGKYIFGDHNNGKIWALSYSPGSPPIVEELLDIEDGRLGTFGLDADGEIYIITVANRALNGGFIYKLSRSGNSVPEPPATLSGTGAFSDLGSLTPRGGVIPYDLIQPLWSDGAEKKRWLSIPNDGTPDSPGEQIGFSETEPWTFPVGSVLIKHFEIAGRRLETRFLVKGTDSKFFGFTYKWRADQSDADLLPGPAVDETITLSGGQQIEWHYPSRTECFICHTDASKTVLGPKTRHLNKELFYPETGRTANQLVTLNDQGFFSPGFDPNAVGSFLISANINDTSESLERRARSYIDINCSQCHQPGGPTQAQFDSRFTVPSDFQNIINVDPLNPLGLSDPKLVEPGNVPDSILYLRMNTLDGCCAMPPLAKNAVDTDAVNVVADWIRSLDPTISPTGPTSETPPQDYSTPKISLAHSGPSEQVNDTFDIVVNANEPIFGLTASDFEVTNGKVNSVSGSGTNWTASITPTSLGSGTISIPSDRVADANGNANLSLTSPLNFEYGSSEPPVNLLVDGGFEEGAQHWHTGGSVSSTNEVFSGNTALEFGESSFVVQTVLIEPFDTFRYTGWYTRSASLGHMEVGVSFYDGNGNELQDTFNVPTQTESYSSFQLDVTAPEGAETATVYVLTGGGGTAKADALSFIRTGSNDPNADPNQFSNGGFEEGSLSGWDSGSSPVSTSTDARTGTYAAKFETDSFLIFNQSASPGDKYRFSGHYKTSSPGGIHEVGIVYWNQNGGVVFESEIDLTHSESFSPFEVSGTAPAGTAAMSVWIYSGFGSDLTVDDFALELLEGTLPTNSQTVPPAVSIAGTALRTILSNRDPLAYQTPSKNPVQPDLAITHGNDDWVGFDIYNANAAGQKKKIKTRNRRIREIFEVVWQNDAAKRFDRSSFFATRGNRHFKVKYFTISVGKRNVTSSFITGRFKNQRVAPLEISTYEILIREKRKSRRKAFRGRIFSRSELNSSRVDAVLFKARGR